LKPYELTSPAWTPTADGSPPHRTSPVLHTSPDPQLRALSNPTPINDDHSAPASPSETSRSSRGWMVPRHGAGMVARSEAFPAPPHHGPNPAACGGPRPMQHNPPEPSDHLTPPSPKDGQHCPQPSQLGALRIDSCDFRESIYDISCQCCETICSHRQSLHQATAPAVET